MKVLTNSLSFSKGEGQNREKEIMDELSYPASLGLYR